MCGLYGVPTTWRKVPHDLAEETVAHAARGAAPARGRAHAADAESSD